ncbi:hypothetical protein CEXT_657081 [Caerostris extrusa]|uniref:Uncharacterized protein n=1 Tax=Caerostris extrusa TaxID=172846 RepID=A0AAV4M7G5_CAEEX|nr:hypothetical protein CEXT_657081 [Caerostris extrusa]
MPLTSAAAVNCQWNGNCLLCEGYRRAENLERHPSFYLILDYISELQFEGLFQTRAFSSTRKGPEHCQSKRVMASHEHPSSNGPISRSLLTLLSLQACHPDRLHPYLWPFSLSVLAPRD